MSSIRRAERYESEILNDIAVRSEAYWGYDCNFIKNFITIYKVTEAFIINNSTFVIEENEEIIGFYGALTSNTEVSLEYLYVDPTFIGMGYGKLLWCHLVDNSRNRGIKEITLVTSPQAKEFYEKMGATQIGEVESLVKEGRKIPKLIFTM